MKRQNWKIVHTLLLFILLVIGCAKQENMNNECIMQINNVGLRQGVFVRRYKLTSDFGSHEIFSPEILKKFIQEILEPDYLLIQDAYERKFHEESATKQKIEEYRINLLAGSHPFKYETMTILKQELRDFYQKKSVKYDVDLVLTNSYNMADSIYKSIVAGNEIELPKKEELGSSFPQYLQYKDVTYGERLHPEIFTKLIDMKQGEINEPVFTAPIWTIVRLNKKRETKELPSFENMEKELLTQAQAIFKYEGQKRLITELKEKYKLSIRTEFYQPLISVYVLEENHGWIDKNKLSQSDLTATFLQIKDDAIPLSEFIYSFNQANQNLRFSKLTEQDISHFADVYIAQYLLYLDALEKGVDQDKLIQDQLVNKEHRLLLSQYLKEEIAQKVVITDADAKKYYEDNRDRWKAKYEDVASNVKGDLKNKRLLEKKNELVNQLKKKYKVRYNEALLKAVAEGLSNEKKLKNKEIK